MIIALSLMGFLILLMLGLSALVRVELQTSTIDRYHLQARQNALFGLRSALGELQKNAGPDRRVTGRADISDESSPNAYWTGVWESKPPVEPDDFPRPVAPFNAGAVSNSNSRLNPSESRLINWLVSGNEGQSLAASEDAKPRLSPEDELVADFGEDPSLEAVYLLGASTLIGPGQATVDTVGMAGAVMAPKVAITGVDNVMSGHYAWWVGDEGVKARVQMRHPVAVLGKNADQNTALGFQLPATTDPVVMTDLDFFDSTDTNLSKVYNFASLSTALDADDSASEALHQRWHDLTTVSRGLLTDTRWGGFRGDLTLAFENDAVFERYFNTDDDTYYFVDVDDLGYDAQFPNWEILKSFYQLKDDLRSNNSEMFIRSQIPLSAVSSRSVNPRDDSVPYKKGSTDEGYHKNSPVAPLLARTQITIGLQYIPTGDIDPTDGREWYTPVVLVKPLSALYNPYNVAISRADKAGGGTLAFITRWSLLPLMQIEVTEVDPDTGVETTKQVASGGGDAVKFRLREILSSDGAAKGAIPDVMFQHPNINLLPGQTRLYGLWDDLSRSDFDKYRRVRLSAGPNEDDLYDPMGGYLRLTLGDAWGASRHGHTIYDEEADSDGKFGLTPAEKNFLRVKDQDRIHVKFDAFPGGQTSSVWLTYNSQHKDATEASSIRTLQYYSPVGNNANLSNTVTRDFTVTAATGTTSPVSNLFTWGFWLRGANDAYAKDRLLVDHNVRNMGSPQTWDAISDDFYMSSTFTGELDGSQSYGYIDPLEDIVGNTNNFDGVWGGGTTNAGGGVGRVVLFDVPRSELVSLGALQHANLGRYTFDPSYIVGNSFPPSRLTTTEEYYRRNYNKSGQDYWDLSYLINQQLWDSYYFSGIPKSLDEDELQELIDGTASLPNHRLSVLSSSPPLVPDDLKSTEESDDTFYRAALYLAIEGAFNVNSTSKEAWKAILASAKNLTIPTYGLGGSSSPTATNVENNAAYSRLLYPVGDGYNGGNGDGLWTGYRVLTDDEIDDLAEAIVELIQDRAEPFSSIAEFVNRPLERAPGGNARAGLLQEAINNSGINNGIPGVSLTGAPKASGVTYDPYHGYNSAAAFPGALTQADLLQALGPIMTVRSDTFVVRSYGDAVDPLTGNVMANAWCEAIVQRMPAETVDNGDALSREANRRFRIVNFRWLGKDEV